MLLVSSLFVGLAMSGTTVEEIAALRDDMIHLCHKAYGGADKGQKNCRQNQHITGSTNAHVTFNCWKSGWSGRGKLTCRYGAEAFDGMINMASDGDQTAHSGTQVSRRRMEIEGEEEDVFADATEESKWETQTHPVNFELENLEDENEVTKLGDVAVCFLQGVEYIETEDESVQSKCSVQKNEDGLWELSYTSAKCHVLCFPYGATRMF